MAPHMRLMGKLTLLIALAVCTLAAGAVEGISVETAAQAHTDTTGNCLSQSDVEAALGNASAQMEQSQYADAAAILEPLSKKDCDARVSLLLAAAVEGQGNVAGATAILERAHAVWPTNDSIAASLAREYVQSSAVDKAAKALAHFHVTADMPEQEMQMAAVVYLAAHQLVPAQRVAEAAYKAYPSVHTLLLLANTLQMQGRYPDVNRLLGDKRETYADSPAFFITLAESEFDASNYPAAREDSRRAISLNSKLFQAHYILGNVLFKLDDGDGAIAEYHQAIDLAPNEPRSYFQLALVLKSQRNEAGEQQALEQTLSIDGHYAPAQCEMGRMLLETHRPADAVGHLTTAIQDNPRSEKAYYLLAQAYAQLGEKDKSDQMVTRLLAVQKENQPSADNKSQDHTVTSASTSR
jgi:tetratricopeptide (TPR) repeat protein